MADDPLSFALEMFTFFGILVSAVIFARLAIKAKSVGSFRFQLSFFILIWAVAEVLYVGSDLGLFVTGGLDILGLAFHFVSMAIFALFVGVRSFKYLRIKPIQPPLGVVKPLPLRGAMEK